MRRCSHLDFSRRSLVFFSVCHTQTSWMLLEYVWHNLSSWWTPYTCRSHLFRLLSSNLKIYLNCQPSRLLHKLPSCSWSQSLRLPKSIQHQPNYAKFWHYEHCTFLPSATPLLTIYLCLTISLLTTMLRCLRLLVMQLIPVASKSLLCTPTISIEHILIYILYSTKHMVSDVHDSNPGFSIFQYFGAFLIGRIFAKLILMFTIMWNSSWYFVLLYRLYCSSLCYCYDGQWSSMVHTYFEISFK